MPPLAPPNPKNKKNNQTTDTGNNNGQTADVNTPEHQQIVDLVGEFFNQQNSSNSSSRSSQTSFSITPKENAYSELDQQMIALFGRRATLKEKSAYYRGLNAAEKHYATRSGDTSTSTSTGSTSSGTTTNYLFNKDDFLFEFTANLADTYIKAGKPLGGKAGQVYQDFKSYAASMGVSDDDKTALKNTIKVIRGKADSISIKDNMRKRAISLYGGLADALQRDPTLTVKEAAGDYINIMSNMLDINSNNISLHDPTLSKALNAQKKNGKPYAMNLSEFTSMLRGDARFQYSTMAHTEAANLANSFAKAFGFGG